MGVQAIDQTIFPSVLGIIIYSYLIGVQAIDQNIFPEVLRKTSVLLPEVRQTTNVC
jgi:hypothetical protein